MALIPPSIDGPLGNLNEVASTLRPRKEINDRFAPILERYERFLDVEPRNMDNYLTGINVQVTPPEINQFMHMTRTYENHPQYNSADYGHTGRFVSSLMQCAIRDGYVDFTLDMNGLQPLHGVGYRITGTLENKVNFTINGEVGYWCLYGARNVETANIEKAWNWCLHNAINVGIADIGKAGNWYLYHARNVGTANIRNAEYGCLQDAQNVGTANIGKAGNWCLLHTLDIGHVYTPDPNLVRQIKNYSISWKKGCKLHLISQEDFEARMKR